MGINNVPRQFEQNGTKNRDIKREKTSWLKTNNEFI